jgi:hypothetical protein
VKILEVRSNFGKNNPRITRKYENIQRMEIRNKGRAESVRI